LFGAKPEMFVRVVVLPMRKWGVGCQSQYPNIPTSADVSHVMCPIFGAVSAVGNSVAFVLLVAMQAGVGKQFGLSKQFM